MLKAIKGREDCLDRLRYQDVLVCVCGGGGGLASMRRFGGQPQPRPVSISSSSKFPHTPASLSRLIQGGLREARRKLWWHLANGAVSGRPARAAVLQASVDTASVGAGQGRHKSYSTNEAHSSYLNQPSSTLPHYERSAPPPRTPQAGGHAPSTHAGGRRGHRRLAPQDRVHGGLHVLRHRLPRKCGGGSQGRSEVHIFSHTCPSAHRMSKHS